MISTYKNFSSLRVCKRLYNEKYLGYFILSNGNTYIILLEYIKSY